MRQLIIDLAPAAGVQVAVTDLDLEAVHSADEVFVCNSVVGVWPVRTLQGSEWKFGPLTRRLSRSAEAAMRQAS
jgi:4-amino-4-deoxychorismate lyase